MLNKIHCTDLLKYYTIIAVMSNVVMSSVSWKKMNDPTISLIFLMLNIFPFFLWGVKGALSDFCQMMLMYESTKTKYAHTPTAGKLLHYLRGSSSLIVNLFNVLFFWYFPLFFISHLSIYSRSANIRPVDSNWVPSFLSIITRHAPLLLIGYKCTLGLCPTLWSKNSAFKITFFQRNSIVNEISLSHASHVYKRGHNLHFVKSGSLEISGVSRGAGFLWKEWRVSVVFIRLNIFIPLIHLISLSDIYSKIYLSGWFNKPKCDFFFTFNFPWILVSSAWMPC